MVDISTTLNSWVCRRHKIDHAGAGTKLNQTNLRDAPLFVETKHSRVEVEHPVLVTASQNDVIEFGNLQRIFHFPILP
jgi:hypothetical protein